MCPCVAISFFIYGKYRRTLSETGAEQILRCSFWRHRQFRSNRGGERYRNAPKCLKRMRRTHFMLGFLRESLKLIHLIAVLGKRCLECVPSNAAIELEGNGRITHSEMNTDHN